MNEGEVAVTATVGLPIQAAFDSFTNDIDRWWVRGKAKDSVIRFEGSRLLEATSTGIAVLAAVKNWQPPNQIELDWSGPYSQAGDSVLIEFATETSGTRITIRHRRPGLALADTASAVVGLWWGDLLSRYQTS
jgi:uncharacterized protein YndB with AHSA1/START domain